MAHKHVVVNVLRNFVLQGSIRSIGEDFEFRGEEEELNDLIRDGFVRTEVNLGRATLASDVVKTREALETAEATVAAHQARIVALEAEVEALQLAAVAVEEGAAKIREALNIEPEESILGAIEALKVCAPAEMVAVDSVSVVALRGLLGIADDADPVTAIGELALERKEIAQVLALEEGDNLLEAIKVLGTPAPAAPAPATPAKKAGDKK